MNSLPTVFHLTHIKSGSQWVKAILSQSAPRRIIKNKVGLDQFYNEPIKPGYIYPALYVSREHFYQTISPDVGLDPQTYRPSRSDGANVRNWYNFAVRKEPTIKLVVIRDLRDMMISLYFSIKISHKVITERIAKGRDVLNNLNEEDGLQFIINERLRTSADIQQSWLDACRDGEARLFRYEDLIANEQGEFPKIIDYCQIDVSPKKLEKIVDKNSFIRLAKRKPGEEDISSHYRKGISGDWKNHFTDRIKEEFKKKYGQLLIDTGYEKDFNW